MLAVKAKHATMLLTVSDVEGLPEGLQDMDVEKSKKSSAQAVMVIEHNIQHDITCIVSNGIYSLRNLLTHSAISGLSFKSGNS